MNILIVCNTMTYLSGSSLYHYTLALELKNKGHNVGLYSMWAENELKNNLISNGVMTYYDVPKGFFDLVLISQEQNKSILEGIKARKIINIIHSEYDCETPIISNLISDYIAIRPSIKEHLHVSHNIENDKITVIYNGVDLERFNYKKRVIKHRDYVKVVLPCTMDMLRIKFLEYYTKQASEKYRIYIYGKNYNNEFYKNEWVFIEDEKFNIEDYIADADFVAGILLGRVNLEARAMDIISIIHNPEDPEQQEIYYPDMTDFIEKHDINKVANQIIQLYENLSK